MIWKHTRYTAYRQGINWRWDEPSRTFSLAILVPIFVYYSRDYTTPETHYCHYRGWRLLSVGIFTTWVISLGRSAIGKQERIKGRGDIYGDY